VLDAQPGQRPADLRRLRLLHRFTRFRREEVMAAAIGVEAARQTLRAEDIQQSPEGRDCAFFLDEERRIDLARRIVQRHNQIEWRFVLEPRMAAAILVQHHAFARLARPFAAMHPTARRAFDQPRRLQLRLCPGVTPVKAVTLSKMLVKMLRVPAQILRAIQIQHPANPVRAHPLRRGLADPLVRKTGQPLFFVPDPKPPECPLRHPQNLRRFQSREPPGFPAAQNIPKLLHPAIL